MQFDPVDVQVAVSYDFGRWTPHFRFQFSDSIMFHLAQFDRVDVQVAVSYGAWTLLFLHRPQSRSIVEH